MAIVLSGLWIRNGKNVMNLKKAVTSREFCDLTGQVGTLNLG